jgi:TonB family protein
MGSVAGPLIPLFRSDVNVELRPRWWASLGVSGSLHLLALLILLNVGLLRPVLLESSRPQTPTSFVLIRPVERETPAAPRPPLRAPLQVPAGRSLEPQLLAPPVIQAPVPKIPLAAVDAPPPAVHLRAQPVLNSFPGSSSQLPKLSKPAPQIQTGGFGDPNAVPAAGTAVRSNIAHAGSFDLPAGDGAGNGSGGARGSRGVASSNAFGQAYAPSSTGTPARSVVQGSGFDATNAGEPSGTEPKQAKARPRLTPAEILFKPAPAYTAEARALKIEGEVVAEVLLPASGEARIVRVLHGLGHGLDESAARTIQKMQFKAASENGQAVDSVVVVHILFKLA